uniref:DUF4806 domain-containing protein n=1 Tax=Anopheles epiroticus TaxID=199890 RepID=A0A182PGH5_9DIPT
MERQTKKRAVSAKLNIESVEDYQDEMGSDSDDEMIEFIKVECGTNQDGDPFITNDEVDDNQLFEDGVFEEFNGRKKAHSKKTYKERSKVVREHEVTRDQAGRKPTVPSLGGIEASLMEISNKLDSIGEQFQSILDTVDSKTPKKSSYVDVEFEKIDSLEQLQTFNDELATPEYEEKMRQWLEGNLIDMRSDVRMSDAMDMLFTRKFLTCCSWTGISKGAQKIAMMQMTNVTKLFERIGTTSLAVVNSRRVANFFMKKLKNAGKRALAKGVRKSTSRVTLSSSRLERKCDSHKRDIEKELKHPVNV